MVCDDYLWSWQNATDPLRIIDLLSVQSGALARWSVRQGLEIERVARINPGLPLSAAVLGSIEQFYCHCQRFL